MYWRFLLKTCKIILTILDKPIKCKHKITLMEEMHTYPSPLLLSWTGVKWKHSNKNGDTAWARLNTAGSTARKRAPSGLSRRHLPGGSWLSPSTRWAARRTARHWLDLCQLWCLSAPTRKRKSFSRWVSKVPDYFFLIMSITLKKIRKVEK